MFSSRSGSHSFTSGFTLAELLIALAILGVIATFTIPKILVSQQNSQSNSAAKEVAAMISGAYQQAQLTGTISGGTVPSDLSQYMNYVSVATSGNLVDTHPNSGAVACDASNPCLKLHSGGILQLFADSFGGTNTTNVIQFRFDPDGVYDGLTTDHSGASIQFELYYNGQLTTRGNAKAGSCHSGTCFGPDPTYDPSWFSF